jgi:hypothetical protein
MIIVVMRINDAKRRVTFGYMHVHDDISSTTVFELSDVDCYL